MAFQPAGNEQRVGLACCGKARLVVIDVQDAAPLQVEIDLFALGHRKQVLARFDGHARGLDGVAAVVGDARHELADPRILVPRRLGIEQQRRIVAQHPFDAFEQRAGAVPDLGIAGGKLSTVGKRGFHGRIQMPVEHRDLIAELRERVSSGDAGNTGADDDDMRHGGPYGVMS